MARYASQPALPTNPAFGAQPNSLLTRFRAGQPFPMPSLGAGQPVGAGNPYSQGPQAATGAPATAQGIQQAAQQKMAELGAPVGPLFLGELAPQTLGLHGNGAGALLLTSLGDIGGDSGLGKSASYGEPGRREAAWADLHPKARTSKSRRGLLSKSAGMPMGPATAQPPTAPPPMPTSLGIQGMLPPGATPPGGPPSGDPAAAGGAAPPPGAAPPMDPAAAGGMPGDPMAGGQPPTLNGEVPPMGMPPTPPLPANPRVNPPRQATPDDFRRRQDLNQLLMMDEQASPENTAGSMQPDMLALGAKMGEFKSAFEIVGHLLKAGDYNCPTCGCSWGSSPKCGHCGGDNTKTAGIARGNAHGIYPEGRGSITGACGHLLRDDGPLFYGHSDDECDRCREKRAAQDNGPDQHTLQRSTTGESTNLSYQHKPDHYMQGQDAWASVSQYFKGHSKRKKQPNPFRGEHDAVKSAGETKARPGRLLTRYDLKYYGEHGRMPTNEEVDAYYASKEAMDTDYAMGGLPMAPRRPGVRGRDIDPLYQTQNRLRLNKLRGRRRPQAQPKTTIDSATTQFKYAADYGDRLLRLAMRRHPGTPEEAMAAFDAEFPKEAAMPYMGKSTMPVTKPALNLKPTPPAPPFNPGGGVLKMKPVMNSLKPPNKAPKMTAPSLGQGSRPKLAMDKLAFLWPLIQAGAREGLKKAPGMLMTGARRAVPTAYNVGKAVVTSPQLKRNIAGSAIGYGTAGFTGDGSSGGKLPEWIPFLGGQNFDYGRAATGAAMFNPALRRYAARGNAMSRAAQMPMNMFRYNAIGRFGGQAADYSLGQFGLDTGGAGERWGGHLGTTIGAGRSLNRLTGGRVSVPTGVGGRQVFNPGAAFNRATSGFAKGMNDFSMGVASPAFGLIRAIPNAFGRGMRPFVRPGGRISRFLDGAGVPQVGQRIPWLGGPAKSLPGYIGKSLGTGGLAITGGMLGLDLARSGIQHAGQEAMKKTYEEMAPQIAADVTGVADRYLDSVGMMGQDGRAQLPIANSIAALGDQIFQSVGMDPSQMSPAQKISILGGMGLLGTGAAVGSGGMAGLGGLAMGGGMMSGGSASPLMQLLRRLPRNEYLTQLEQTGQMPNANPYGQMPGNYGPTL